MGKGGRLTKLKSALKKWPSSNKLDCTNGSSRAVVAAEAINAGNLHPVYVGRCRRRYLVSSKVLDHPVFQVLVSKTDGSDGVTVACEVVLFEHLLWMLDSDESQLESVDELVEFYSY